MMLWEQQAAFAKDVSKLIEYIFLSGYTCTFGEAYRTRQQAELYAQEGKGIVDSLHCDRLAVDLNLYTVAGTYLTTDSDYEQFGKYWESLDPDNRWGGCFKRKDGNHFERQMRS